MTLRILHLEDEPEFSTLVQATLESFGLPNTIYRVRSRRGFEEAVWGWIST